jgi:hypothetical protein
MERIAVVVAAMSPKPSKQQIAHMARRLLRMPSTAAEIRDEAIARLEHGRKFASSAVIDKLMANGDDDKEDDSQRVMQEAA